MPISPFSPPHSLDPVTVTSRLTYCPQLLPPASSHERGAALDIRSNVGCLCHIFLS